MSDVIANRIESRFARVSLAQLVEQLTLNQWVESSSLSGDTKRRKRVSFLFPERREEPSGVKECLGWHSERSVRAVPTARNNASIEQQDANASLFLCLIVSSERRESHLLFCMRRRESLKSRDIYIVYIG